MKDPKAEIASILETSILEMGVKDVRILVEKPKDISRGDYTSNIALIVAKQVNKSPLEIGEALVEKFKKIDWLQGFEVDNPGFINFRLSNEYLQTQIKEIIQLNSKYGSSNLGRGKKASVEFVSANPTGPLHIGNARGGPIGDTLANVLEKAGFQVTREYLHNDVGVQVGKLGEAIYYVLNPNKKPTEELSYQADYVKDLAAKVKQNVSANLEKSQFITKAGEEAVKIMLHEIMIDTRAMGIEYNVIRKESDLRKKAQEAINELKKKGVIKEKDKALWFAPSDEFLKDRETVVRKSNGEYTYFSSDIVYHKEKMEKNDLVIDVFGSNHSGHVPRLQAVVKALGYDPEKLKFIIYQFVRLKRGNEVVRMGKRFGNIITAKEVLDEVGRDAFRFFLLTPRPETHMDFDLELAKQKAAENPVFYIQYAYSRICSIFKKTDNKHFSDFDIKLLTTPEEIDLIRHLLKFPDLVEEISQNFAVNQLTTYSLDLATCFHKFYESTRVLSDNVEERVSRLALLKATQIVLKNTLDLMGISAPEKM